MEIHGSLSLTPATAESPAAATHACTTGGSVKTRALRARSAPVVVALRGAATRANTAESVVAPATVTAAIATADTVQVAPAAIRYTSPVRRSGPVCRRCTSATSRGAEARARVCATAAILVTRAGTRRLPGEFIARGIVPVGDALAMARIMLPATTLPLHLAAIEVAIDVRSLVDVDVDVLHPNTSCSH